MARAILAPSSVTLPTQRASFSLRLRCPGKQLTCDLGDKMRIETGRGAEDVSIVRDSLRDKSGADIVNDP